MRNFINCKKCKTQDHVSSNLSSIFEEGRKKERKKEGKNYL
jgi:hypothetical protein